MSKDEIINQTISKFREECSKITEEDFISKLKQHEDIMIKVILEALLKNN